MGPNHAFLILILSILGVEALAEAPAWFTNSSQKKTGNIIEVSCSGRGPDKTLANQTSLNECRGIAVQYVQGYSIKTKSLAIEDNTQASWHSEILGEAVVIGLECEPLKQECTKENESWTCYHVCRFNLARAKLEPQVKEDSSKPVADIDSVVANPDETDSPKTKKGVKPSFIQSGTRTLILTTVPTCNDVLIVGNPSRTVQCKDMPVTLTINDSDREAIARLSGYKPKHLQFAKRKLGSESKPVEATVYFEK